MKKTWMVLVETGVGHEYANPPTLRPEGWSTS